MDGLRRVVEHTRHNNIGCIGGHIFTGMEAIAFAYPPGYPAGEDHVPCLGFLDRWRRPMPEQHHLWKLYAPVEIHDPQPARRGELLVLAHLENRSAVSRLDDYRFTWTAAGRGGPAVLQSSGELHLPIADAGPVEVSCWDRYGRLVNRWRYSPDAAAAPAIVAPPTSARAFRNETGIVVEHGSRRWCFPQAGLPVVYRANGERALWDSPAWW